MENIIKGFKEKDDKMTFIMKRIIDFSGKGPTNEEIQHENLQKEAAIKDQFESVDLPSYTYSNPYTRGIDRPMYKLPKNFNQQSMKFSFDGKGNPHQHIAHFVETYNSVGISGDLVSPYPRPGH
ncbi:hypothetical protein ES319_D07G150600v1 [Gossypium barbadense]|uniref:Uncharacterized protein n=2 Tax=Gossypium TaxID=3633 RepID=A0A5J5QXX3_GOSBA|nr:hypothetical protein ES319_D07G150600v1 [Gossypium barbadense]TYG61581.1 hypothetical protein ES288_D07G160200v1 [Gossypium darwinii]